MVMSTPAPGTAAPGVSVIMPVLNEEHHLADSVDAILASEYAGPIEVVLALGPSQDATDKVAHELAATHPAITLVDNPSGRTSAGLNAAIDATSSVPSPPR
jgi:succinoglycan biosynthesis protein ExoA